MKKRGWKSLLTVVAFVLIPVAVHTSIAYFTSKDRTGHIFTVGNVSIRLDEPGWDPKEDHFIEREAVYEKDPTVTNTGKNDAYVRIHLTVTKYQIFKEHGGAAFEPSSMFDINEKWVLTGKAVEKDTITYVYAYREILETEKETEALFDTVSMPSCLSDEMIGELETFDVIVKADAIQAEGFEDYEEAFAAFEAQIGG